jgi:hypothetical protein
LKLFTYSVIYTSPEANLNAFPTKEIVRLTGGISSPSRRLHKHLRVVPVSIAGSSSSVMHKTTGSLLDGKLPRNLSWSDVHELIGQVGEVKAHGDDEFEFVFGSQRAFFKRPHTHNLDVEEISRLRSFLREAGLHSSIVKPHHPGRMLVVIDHHAARLYQDVSGIRSEDETTVKPYDPYGFHRHLIHRKEAHYQGDRAPEEASFYEQVAKDLAQTSEIILVGHGTGKSNVADFWRNT